MNLERCPFCKDSSVKLETKRNYIGDNDITRIYQVSWSVRCNKCHARGSVASGRQALWYDKKGSPPTWHKSDEELKERAAELWNAWRSNETN